MKHIHHASVILAVSALLVVGACGTSPVDSMSAGTSTSATITAQLSGPSEVPTVATDAARKVEANLHTAANPSGEALGQACVSP
jgi:hypothetical protein